MCAEKRRLGLNEDQIRKHIREEREEVVRRYFGDWDRMISDWQQDGAGDFVWLMFSSSYLCRTSNVRWAVDPATLHTRMSADNEIDLANDLSGLSFALLSHRHVDHFDAQVVGALSSSSTRWVVPEFILNEVTENTAISEERIVVPRPMQPIRFGEVLVTPFEGLHDPPERKNAPGSVPSMGYIVDVGRKRLLFPGDVRHYDAGSLPDFGDVDVLFAHLWFGRASSLLAEPPMFESFCRFCVDLKPRKIVVAHLFEVGREDEDYWSSKHADMATNHWREKAPDIDVIIPRFGDRIAL